MHLELCRKRTMYQSKITQNQLLECIGKLMLDCIVSDVNASGSSWS